MFGANFWYYYFGQSRIPCRTAQLPWTYGEGGNVHRSFSSSLLRPNSLHWECDRCEKAFKEHCNPSVTPFSLHHYLALAYLLNVTTWWLCCYYTTTAASLFSSGDVRRRNHFIGDALLNVITLFNQGNGDIADGQVHCHPTKMLSSQALRILTDDPVRAATASVSVRHIMLGKCQKCSKILVLCP